MKKYAPAWEIRFDKKFRDPTKLVEIRCKCEIQESFVCADRIKRFIRKEMKLMAEI